MRYPATLLLASLLVAPVYGQSTTTPCGKLADVPEPRMELSPPSSMEPLRRVHALVELFARGDGRFERSASPASPTPRFENLALYPLPWRVAPEREEGVRLVTWQDRVRGNDENMTAIVLEPGASWCTPPLDFPGGARLRFEAISVARDEKGTLAVHLEGAGDLFEGVIPHPGSLDASRQTDLALATDGSVCFRASGSTVAVGEARVLAPEPSESERDPRPRWLVLTIVDTLRGDTLRREDSFEIAPAMSGLAASGHHYEKALSPGCHTRASVWPILMGRDLMRIDPFQRRQSMPIQSPLEEIYSRANLFASHLAEAAGYHSVFLGNNAYLQFVPAFSRFSSWGKTDRGTIDTIEKLPELFARYGDERIALFYYVSAPHAHSEIPRRLYEELRCSERDAVDRCHCSYEARARHADEAIEALQKGLRAYGLADDIVQFVTGDHGELLGDGMKLEGEIPTHATGERRGAFQRFDLGHGSACHALETDVPLVVAGKGIAPGRWAGPVSGLDIVPTMLSVMGVPPGGKLDGALLPLSASRPPAPRPIVSYGFCADSHLEGGEQLVWWTAGCRVRNLEGEPVTHRAEIWKGGRRVATDATDPDRLGSAMRTHESWLRERLPSEAFVLGTMGLEEATVVVRVENGRIIDYGPSSSVFGIEGIEVLNVASDGTELVVRFRHYEGLFHVSTLPERARVRVEVENHPGVLTFVGPLQLPLSVAGRTVDPAADTRFLFSPGAPVARDSLEPAIRFWWQGYGSPEESAASRGFSDFDRVLREWGYIR